MTRQLVRSRVWTCAGCGAAQVLGRDACVDCGGTSWATSILGPGVRLGAMLDERKRHGAEYVYRHEGTGGTWWVRCDCGWRGEGERRAGGFAGPSMAEASAAFTVHAERCIEYAGRSAGGGR